MSQLSVQMAASEMASLTCGLGHNLVPGIPEASLLVFRSQSRENVAIRWDVGLNRKKLAFFSFPRDEAQLRLAPGAATLPAVPCLQPSDGLSCLVFIKTVIALKVRTLGFGCTSSARGRDCALVRCSAERHVQTCCSNPAKLPRKSAAPRFVDAWPLCTTKVWAPVLAFNTCHTPAPARCLTPRSDLQAQVTRCSCGTRRPTSACRLGPAPA